MDNVGGIEGFNAMKTEHQEQVEVVRWFNKVYPDFKHLLFAIPNGAVLAGDKTARMKQMSRLKAEGLEPGTPDLMLAMPSDFYNGLFIEMKRADGGSRLSGAQKRQIERLRGQGYRVECAHGADFAKKVISEHLFVL